MSDGTAADADGSTRALASVEPLALIAIGGFVGAIARHALAIALPATPLPWGRWPPTSRPTTPSAFWPSSPAAPSPG